MESKEFVLAMGSGDYPHVRSRQLPYTEGVAPGKCSQYHTGIECNIQWKSLSYLVRIKQLTIHLVLHDSAHVWKRLSRSKHLLEYDGNAHANDSSFVLHGGVGGSGKCL